MSEKITFIDATRGVPPDHPQLYVVDLRTGEEVERVIMVDTTVGALVRELVNEAGEPFLVQSKIDGQMRIATERIEGRFEVRRREPPAP